MSLRIDVDKVVAVLLADGWHEVADQSFDTDAYEFVHDGGTILSGGQSDGVCATGFTFTTKEAHRVSGPLTAILAVKTPAVE